MIFRKLVAISALCLCCGLHAQESEKKDAPKKIETKKSKVSKSKGIEYDIKITNGHLAKVILGINKNGTDKYDKGLDDMAPPPGMHTGYTSLVSPDKKFYLYRDTRAPGEKIEWLFFADPYNKDKPVSIKWYPKSLPEGYKWLIFDSQNRKKIEMAKESSYQIKTKTAFKIIATKK